MRAMTAWGVDGCRSGWFWFRLNGVCATCGVAPAFNDLAAGVGDTDRLFVDIPIGLVDGARPCDTEARRLLGPRASSVFPAPPRAVLEAPDYPTANARSRTLSGRGLSKQAWRIVPKIREVDSALRRHERLRSIVREVHPELCFRALNGGRPLAHYKKTRPGFEERIELLAAAWPGAEDVAGRALLRHCDAGVARDDVLDALVNAVTARCPAHRLATVPEAPGRDATGLPMEMVYAAATP